MKSFTYFHINNIKFNYTLEFQSRKKADYWKLNVPLIEYCETLGINIPHYCYHKSLSVSGNCRMCLVEVKNSPKPVVSCAMSARSCLNNSQIFTNSPLVKKSRENILEFLLLNHPLDCPVCDQGGECDLQDQSFFFGMSKKRFYNFKRIVADKNLGAIVKTVMTRCIHCTRCVRFAREIAGVSDLGMFGRGVASEIGTYVQKTFQSELSGNVIELCPVGALTSKVYPFASRSWELKNVKSIDFSDGFGSDLQVFIKNNRVFKINSTINSQWISDKTRFAFDGMFSPERVLEGFVVYEKKKLNSSVLWSVLFEEVINTLYFHDHLSRHFFTKQKLVIVFDNNISLEVLNLLILFSNKYSFISLRKSEGNAVENDLESNIVLNSHENLKTSDLCVLIGVNTRYEGSNLNLHLRNRFLKGNFKITSIGSVIDSNIPSTYLGLNVRTIKDMCEGNLFLCQELLGSTNPVIIVSSEVFKRQDSESLSQLLKTLKKTLALKFGGWDNLNVLSSSVNEMGVNYLNSFKSISVKDVQTSTGVYFLNASATRSSNLQKIIGLKALNYFNLSSVAPGFCVEHNNSMASKVPESFLSAFSVYNYVNLPNNVFFETSGTYLNTQGYFKKSVKFIRSQKQTKDDWQIIRKLFSYVSKIKFVNNELDNHLISFNNLTSSNYKNFIVFLYFANNFISSKLIFNGNTKISGDFDVFAGEFKISKKKISLTNFKCWLSDFYIGARDSYSNNSINMINCSKLYRLSTSNFNK